MNAGLEHRLLGDFEHICDEPKGEKGEVFESNLM